jgi:hypothetical protein
MARVNFLPSNRAVVALAAAATKTVLLVKSPSAVQVAVKSASICFDSSNAGQQGITVELVRFDATSAGTSTNVSNPSKKHTGSLAPASTVQSNYTAEPTVAEILMGFVINPSAGVQYPFPINEEIIIKNGESLGIRVTTPTGVTANAYAAMECEE